jgi:spoIIIJ-associated protein
VKDPAFTGRTVQDALEAAASGLGLPVSALRYVVLDEGSSGGRGVKPSPARIAILLDAIAGGRRTEAPPEAPPATEPRAAVRAVVRAVTDAAGLDLSADFQEEKGGLSVRLAGRDTAFILGDDGEGVVLRALEHLVQRAYATAGGEEPLRVECEGFRDRRDRALTERALALAQAVLGDGQSRTTDPLNAYERRIVHIALSGREDVVTFSVGEGADRRVTVALAPPPGRPDEG